MVDVFETMGFCVNFEGFELIGDGLVGVGLAEFSGEDGHTCPRFSGEDVCLSWWSEAHELLLVLGGSVALVMVFECCHERGEDCLFVLVDVVLEQLEPAVHDCADEVVVGVDVYGGGEVLAAWWAVCGADCEEDEIVAVGDVVVNVVVVVDELVVAELEYEFCFCVSDEFVLFECFLVGDFCTDEEEQHWCV